jgi:hypothetical protein
MPGEMCMPKKPTYEDLEKRVRDLEFKASKYSQIEEELRDSRNMLQMEYSW